MAARHKSNEITLTRIYDAPVKAVWEAWTDPAQTAQWWGPRGFTLTTHSKDLKVGGSWRYTMHGPDGADHPNRTDYLEIVPYSKLVYDHGGNDDHAPMFRVTVLFSEDQGKTRMDMTMALPTPEAAEATRAFIRQAGGDATWDRLAEYLDRKISGKERFVITRSFDAPVDVVFSMWTNPKHFSQWLAPAGFQMQFIRADIRSGGGIFYTMSGNGITMHGRAEYSEIQKPDRLIYTQQFCDENEKPIRHPFSATWPLTMLTVVQFAQEDGDRTRITVTWEPCGNNTPEEIDTFVKGRAGMTIGWTGSLDKLEAYLSESAGAANLKDGTY